MLHENSLIFTHQNRAILSCTLADTVLKELICNLEKHRGEQTTDLHLYQTSDRGSSTELGVEGAVGVKYMLATYMYKLFTGE